jgi:transcriptional regulator GlxA family with amidase domain
MSGLIGGCCAGKKQGVAKSSASAIVATCVGKTILMNLNIVNLFSQSQHSRKSQPGGTPRPRADARYAARIVPVIYKGGLARNRLKRVLDYIEASLNDNNITLAQFAAIAGISPHYFSELFKLSTGRTPHNYVLL